MAALAFLFAPEAEIPPSTDLEWFAQCCGWINGTYMAWIAARRAMSEDRRPRQAWFDSPNLTVNAADYMHLNRPEHKEGYQRYVAERLAAWQAQGMPDTLEESGPAQFCALTGTTSRLGLDKLVAYRGGLLAAVPQKKLKRGGRLGLVANQADPFHFRLDHELDLAEELIRAVGGDALALWTFGHTLQLVLLRAAPGQRPRRLAFSIRLSRPSDRSRRASLATQLARLFEGSALTPDWKAVEGLLAAPEIAVGPWFEAFGVPGAEEMIPKDAAAQWDALDAAGTRLLQGEVPDAAAVKRLNALLGKIGDDKLPAKPGKGMARKLFSAAVRLRQATALPAGATRWQERFAAASRYEDIVDASMDSLTTGQDKQGKGASAALGRLMVHYPETFRRDGWFCSLAALEAEAANGHSFVPAMETLAPAAHTAGFTLVVLPADRQASFRQASGIDGGRAESERGWSAEIFVDLPGMLKADVAEVSSTWLAKSKADGVVVRCESDGATSVKAFKGGKPHDDPAAVLGVALKPLAEAARGLDPRGALRALGFAELLAPLPPVAATDTASASRPRLALAETEGWPAELPEKLEPGDGTIRILVAVTSDDDAYIDRIATDITGGVRYPIRREGRAIQTSTRERLWARELLALLGDLPAGSVFAAASGAGRFRFSAG